MKKILLFFISFSGLILIVFVFCFKIFANIDDQINQVTQQLNSLKEELSQKEANYSQLSSKLEQIKTRLGQLENDILQKEKDLKKGEEVLLYQKTLLNERAKSYYKNINKNTLNLINIFISTNLSLSLRDFFYQKSLIDEDRKTIIKIVLYIKNLEEQKAKLEKEKNQLSSLKKEVDEQSKALSSQIGETRQKIAQLSALQQQLIAQKLASLNISRSAASLGRCDSDLTNGRDPGFSPKFAFFTYGVPNRVGLNQWGAYGRAKSGQNEEQILRAYYNFDNLESVDTNIKINVEGYGEFSLEDYVKRIYEVPDSWGSDGFSALKAQAIAARSYALAYTGGGGGSICPTERCQVFKPDPKGGFWEQAVNETAGKVMKKDGQIIKAWYSSTHGGYVFKSSEVGWSDTSWTKHANDFDGEVSGFSDLKNKAYDKDSPWFYCDWGWRADYNKTAWLKPEEVADIVNVLLLAKIDSSVGEYLYQEDKPNPSGKETWDKNKVKEELRKRGKTPFNLIYEGSVNADFSYGRTTMINFSGDAGNVSFDGREFKDWFNLRAPANIQIVGPLYNIEKR
jgi:peptidoglycan hydrolase-like amidase